MWCILLSVVLFSHQYDTAVYTLDTYVSGNDILNAFDLSTDTDPYGGIASYPKDENAKSKMIQPFHNSMNFKSYLDGATIHSPKLVSKKSFSSGLFILDVKHVPSGCGVWPSFLTIDTTDTTGYSKFTILEGVNGKSNAYSAAAHKTTGTDSSTRCIAQVDDGIIAADGTPKGDSNRLDSARLKTTNVIGTEFNNDKGGYYIGEWDPSIGLRVWAFKRKDLEKNVQSLDFFVKVFSNPQNGSEVDTELLADVIPNAFFHFNTAGDCGNKFKDQKVMITTSFCGKWAKDRFVSDKCGLTADTCETKAQALVTGNDAYWSINSVRFYEKK